MKIIEDIKEVLSLVKSLREEVPPLISLVRTTLKENPSYYISRRSREQRINSLPDNLKSNLFELIGLNDYSQYRLLLVENSITIGRSSLNIFPIPENSLSRTHAKIKRQNHVTTIEDLGSTNGTLVNNKPLQKNQKIIINDGDIIQLGKVKLKYRKFHR